MLKLWTLVFLTTFSANSFANKNADILKSSLAILTVDAPLINEIVSLTPIENHHFNLKAPQACGEKGTIKKTARKISCQFHESGTHKITVSVCDDAKKYCKQEYFNAEVQKQKSGTPRLKQDKTSETAKMQNESKKLLMADFQSLTPEKARLAAQTKKGLFVLVSTEWCPPCNVAREFLLSTKAFKEITKDFLLIYVDGDTPLASEWQPILKTFFYPSFVILNKNMEAIDLKMGYFYTFELKEWVTQSLTNINNPINHLKARMEARLRKSLWQKIKDSFVTKESLEADEKRWIQYLTDITENAEAVKYMKFFSPEKYAPKILRTEYTDVWFGKASAAYPAEKKKEKLETLAKAIFQSSMQDKDDWIYTVITEKYCSKKQKKESEKVFSTEDCKQAQAKIDRIQIASRKQYWDKLTPSEKHLDQATQYQEEAERMLSANKASQAKELYKKCMNEYSLLTDFTPLKEKSRALRIQKLKCLDKDQAAENLALLQSLAKDYPYDATFHYKLSSFYLKKKDYKKAEAANAKALTYSYGNYWTAAAVQQVKILKGLKKFQQAMNVVEKTLQEIPLEKDDKKEWVINSLRAEQRDLTKKLKK